MQTIRIHWVLIYCYFYCVTGFQSEKCDTDDDIKLLPFQSELEQLFHAIGENDTEQIEKMFQFLEANVPNISVEFDECESNEYRQERMDFVVCNSFSLNFRWK